MAVAVVGTSAGKYTQVVVAVVVVAVVVAAIEAPVLLFLVRPAPSAGFADADQIGLAKGAQFDGARAGARLQIY